MTAISTATSESRADSERLLVISADCHAGPPVDAYRPFVDPAYHQAFDDYATQVRAYLARFGNEVGALRLADSADPRARLRAERDGVVGQWDAHQRIKDLNADGIAAEVMFPQGSVPFHKFPPLSTTNGDVVFPATVDTQAAGCRAYNRWLASICEVEPERHVGVGVVPIRDVARAVAEVEWARDAGLRGISLPPVRVGDDPGFPMYNDPVYEPFWSVCEALHMPLHAHGISPISYGGGPENSALIFAECDFFARRSLWFLIFSGVFERHPGLQLVFTEQRAGWVKPTLELLDSILPMDGSGSTLTDVTGMLKLPRKPSDYFATNCWIGASFMSHAEAEDRYAIGVDRIMWGSDYPHAEGTWPWSTASMRMTFAGVAEGEVRKMLGDNAVRCYGLEQQTLQGVASEIGPRLTDVTAPLESVPAGGKLTWAFRATSGWS